MAKIRVRIKASFGDVEIESDSAEDLLKLMESAPKDFGERVAKLGPKLAARISERIVIEELGGIVERTERGPIIAVPSTVKLTHYDAIGLLLYSSKGMTSTAAKLSKLLRGSGMDRVMVPARLNEMRSRHLVYKPLADKPDWRLSSTGKKWVGEVVERIRRQVK